MFFLRNIGRYSQIPAGAIIFFNDTSVPTGWTRYSAPDGKFILGASSTYAPESTGGTDAIATEEEVSSGGNHATGDIYPTLVVSSGGGPEAYYGTDGAHTHLCSVDYFPEKNDLLMIQAQARTNKFPAKSVLLAQSSVAGLSNILDNDYYLGGNSAISSSAQSATVTMSSAGSHDPHEEAYNYSDGTSGAYDIYLPVAAGAHTTEPSMTINESIKHFCLSAWTHAANQISLSSGLILLWESLTPPPGYVVCDGNNGTQDLRDCIVKTVANGSEGYASSGDHSITIPAQTLTHTGSHTHKGIEGEPRKYKANPYHDTYAWSHTHDISEVDISWLPPYYALTFIMKR